MCGARLQAAAYECASSCQLQRMKAAGLLYTLFSPVMLSQAHEPNPHASVLKHQAARSAAQRLACGSKCARVRA